MKWRPEGWENPYEEPDAPYLTEKHILRALEENKSDYERFERGADAMLNALREQTANFSFEIGLRWTELTPMPMGKIVVFFIPDDTESENQTDDDPAYTEWFNGLYRR